MAGETAPPGGATRFIEPTRGRLSYSQLAPILAERVLEVERAIATGHFSSQPTAPKPTDAAGEKTYFAALHSGDQNRWQPLMKFWEQRFEQFTDATP